MQKMLRSCEKTVSFPHMKSYRNQTILLILLSIINKIRFLLGVIR